MIIISIPTLPKSGTIFVSKAGIDPFRVSLKRSIFRFFIASLYSSLTLILSELITLLCLGEPILCQSLCRSMVMFLSLSSLGFQKVLSVFGIILGTERVSADLSALIIWLQ